MKSTFSNSILYHLHNRTMEACEQDLFQPMSISATELEAILGMLAKIEQEQNNKMFASNLEQIAGHFRRPRY